KIGGTDAEMPEIEQTPKPNIKTQPAPDFKPLERKIRKSGTGCVYQINDTLWEGSYYPRLPNGKRKKFNVYAKTKEECEKLLAEMIEEKKTAIKVEKQKQKEGDS
ncbi:MAG: site-specific integrase, partial [Clostridia bacterium]|nr:site-specific integrase [Clostridia bacterium]